MWHLLNTHPSALLNPNAKHTALEHIMFANATMHPAYGRLFFLSQQPEQHATLMQSAANAITKLWAVVETKLVDQPYLGGHSVSAGDIMLAVYARWGQMFDVDIEIGPNCQRMIAAVQARDSFQAAIAAEQQVV